MSAEPFPKLASPRPNLRVCVVVPARNEAELVVATLKALAIQFGLGGLPLDPSTWEVLVLANNCTDETAQMARRFAASPSAVPRIFVVEREFPADVAHIGTARKYLMDWACDRLDGLGHSQVLIASTDADTRVGRTWIAAQLFELDRGADAVAGLIQVASAELRALGPRVCTTYRADRLYRRLKLELEMLIDPNPLDSRPGHDFHGGASLAITPGMYRRVGGLPPLRSLEDVALVEALWLADARLVHSRAVRVRTSARLVGRAEQGESSRLEGWAGESPTTVANVAAFETELINRQALRRLFRQEPPKPEEVARVAAQLGVDPVALTEGIGRWATFGACLAGVRNQLPGHPTPEPLAPVPITVAIDQLRERIRFHRRFAGPAAPTWDVPRGRSGTLPLSSFRP